MDISKEYMDMTENIHEILSLKEFSVHELVQIFCKNEESLIFMTEFTITSVNNWGDISVRDEFPSCQMNEAKLFCWQHKLTLRIQKSLNLSTLRQNDYL